MNIRRVLPVLVLAIVGAWLWAGVSSARPEDQLLSKAKEHFSPLPKVFESTDNPITPAKVELGKMLFYESRISADGSVSCFRCHWSNLYYADGIKTPVRAGCQTAARNSQTVLNAAGEISQHWSGSAPSVEAQAEGALSSGRAYGVPGVEGEQHIKAIPGYIELFQKAFPEEKDPVTAKNFGRAVGAFERTLSTPSGFDDYLQGKTAAIPAGAKAGLQAFMDTGCAGCHNAATVGGRTYAKFGVTRPYWDLTMSPKPDEGRFEVTKDEADKYVFKVAPLRNIRMTAPYFHDGSVARLEDAVKIMASLQLGQTLTDARIAEIVSFLDCLTGKLSEEALKSPVCPPTI